MLVVEVRNQVLRVLQVMVHSQGYCAQNLTILPRIFDPGCVVLEHLELAPGEVEQEP